MMMGLFTVSTSAAIGNPNEGQWFVAFALADVGYNITKIKSIKVDVDYTAEEFTGAFSINSLTGGWNQVDFSQASANPKWDGSSVTFTAEGDSFFNEGDYGEDGYASLHLAIWWCDAGRFNVTGYELLDANGNKVANDPMPTGEEEEEEAAEEPEEPVEEAEAEEPAEEAEVEEPAEEAEMEEPAEEEAAPEPAVVAVEPIAISIRPIDNVERHTVNGIQNFVSFRDVAEAYGAAVAWDGENMAVIVNFADGNNATVIIADVNGVLENNRVFIPLSAALELFE
jgi:hypothetical protein